jgi:hypothetical protein
VAQAEAQWGRMPQRDPLGAVWQRLRLLIHLCWPRDRSRPPPKCSPLQGKACGAWLEEEGGSEGLVVPSSSQADGIRRGGAQPGTLRARVPRRLAGGPLSLGAAAHRPASGPRPLPSLQHCNGRLGSCGAGAMGRVDPTAPARISRSCTCLERVHTALTCTAPLSMVAVGPCRGRVAHAQAARHRQQHVFRRGAPWPPPPSHRPSVSLGLRRPTPSSHSPSARPVPA